MVLLIVPFAIVAAGFLLFSLTYTMNAHTGSSTQKHNTGGIMGALRTVVNTVFPLVALGEKALGLAIKVARSTASHWALANLKPLTRWFTGLTHVVRNTSHSQAAHATATADAIERLRHTVIPREINTRLAPVKTEAKTAERHAQTALTRTHALSTTLTREHAAQVTLNRHYTHALDVTLPREIAGLRRREDTLSRDQVKLRERTTSLENGAIKTFDWIRTHPLSAVTGVFAGAVAVALTRLGFGFLRCRNWQSLGRRLTCGMGGLLLDLLGGIIDVLLIADLCQITTLMIDLAESSVVQDALGGIIGGIDDLLLCQNVSRPAVWNVAESPLPPLQAWSALPVVG